MSFFEKQGKRLIEKEYWAFDITSAEICRNERGYLKRIKYIPQELLSI